MAKITCNLKEFNSFVGPKVRNNVATITKNFKISLGYKCQHCNEKNELDAAHKHESTRKDIINSVLDKYKTSNGMYYIADLQKVIEEINDAHLPLENHFIFLCKSCHRQYDSQPRELNNNENKFKKSKQNSSLVPHNAIEIKRYSKSNKKLTNADNNGVEENLSEIETMSWKYKIGWTSSNNRKNIKELIMKIESNFDCYPIAQKSWYYHRRNDNNKQFSGIIVYANRSEICFRIDPNSFTINDSKIIHGKRWFFSAGKEGKIEIIPENYDIIIQCLSHAFEISKYS